MPTHSTARPCSPHRGEPLFWISIDAGLARVTVAGELDRGHAHYLLEALTALVGTRRRSWSIDTERVTFCDAGGLRALAAGTALAARHGCDIRLVYPSLCVQRLLTIVGLGHLINRPSSEESTGKPAPAARPAGAYAPRAHARVQASYACATGRTDQTVWEPDPVPAGGAPASIPHMPPGSVITDSGRALLATSASPDTAEPEAALVAQAYCGPAHGRRWLVDTRALPTVVELELPVSQTPTPDPATCFYRLIVHPRSRRPAHDRQGRYLYMPVRRQPAPRLPVSANRRRRGAPD